MAEVRLTVFQRMIEKVLYATNNEFYLRSRDAGASNAQSIKIPQSSGLEEPVLGGVNSGYFTTSNHLNSATALSPVIIVNDELEYSNTIIRPPHPFVLETLQEAELSYNKAQQLAEEQGMNMKVAIANYFLTVWAQTLAAYIFPTTGLPNPKKSTTLQSRSTSGTTGAKSGYSGLVKRFEYTDLMALESAIKRQNLEGGQWFALPTVEIWEDLKRITDIVDYDKTGNETMLKQGIVGSWGSIRFLDPRQNDRWNANVAYDITTPSAPVPIAYGGAFNSNTVSALICWNDRYVERNLGPIKFFSRKDDPIYMGDIYQWGVRAGGSPRRLDGKGIICVYEDPTTGGAA